MAFFVVFDVPVLVYFSIPTICVYLIGYVLVFKGKLAIYVWMVYIWLTLYMGMTTICLGNNFGFHLYCLSMISVIFVTEYLAYKLEQKSLKALNISIVVCIFYLVCTGFVSFVGPLYDKDKNVAGFFRMVNAVIVLCFLAFYSNWLIRLVISSEKKLSEMAHIDRLTGLFNRHYMMETLADTDPSGTSKILVMADIDHFKKINDTYGHNAGDEVLKSFSDILREDCKGSVISRWGGEEFLILMDAEDGIARKLDALREHDENSETAFDGNIIRTTVTIGMAYRRPGESIDDWIQHADKNLYSGKNSGRNRVVGEFKEGQL